MLINLHSQATTTPKTRAEIQANDAPARVLARRYGTTEQTVWKWRPGSRTVLTRSEMVSCVGGGWLSAAVGAP